MENQEVRVCRLCGSSKTKLEQLPKGLRCVARKHCQRRRNDAIVAADLRDHPKAKQCMGALGSRSITFCAMREGHAGPHRRDGKVWGDEEQTGLGRAMGALLGSLSGGG